MWPLPRTTLSRLSTQTSSRLQMSGEPTIFIPIECIVSIGLQIFKRSLQIDGQLITSTLARHPWLRQHRRTTRETSGRFLVWCFLTLARFAFAIHWPRFLAVLWSANELSYIGLVIKCSTNCSRFANPLCRRLLLRAARAFSPVLEYQFQGADNRPTVLVAS